MPASAEDLDAGYDPGDMERLSELIRAGVRTPRAALERRVETAGEVLRRVAVGSREAL